MIHASRLQAVSLLRPRVCRLQQRRREPPRRGRVRRRVAWLGRFGQLRRLRRSGGSGGATGPGVLTYHNDNARTGLNPDEVVLAPANVSAGTFGKKFSQPVDGYVYAQPLFVPGLTIGGQTHDVVFVVTENNSVFAFDASQAGPVLWHTNVGTALSCSDLNDCDDLVPGAGITGTPVIDPSTQTMYLVSLVKSSAGAHHFLHALDLTSGAEKLGGPVEIAPNAPGTGANSQNGMVTFNPATHYQRCALLLAGGVVYIGIGSNAESDSDNHGWIVGRKASDLASAMTFCASPDDNWVSLWQSGGGLVVRRDRIMSTPRRPTAPSTRTRAGGTSETARSS